MSGACDGAAGKGRSAGNTQTPAVQVIGPDARSQKLAARKYLLFLLGPDKDSQLGRAPSLLLCTSHSSSSVLHLQSSVFSPRSS